MANYIFTNILGSFAVDQNLRVFDKGDEKSLRNKHKNLKEPSEDEAKRILSAFRDQKYFIEFHVQNIRATKQKIKGSVNEDVFITQAIANIEDIDKILNTMCKRLREWYSYYNPEFSHSIDSHEKFAELIQKKSKKELLTEINIREEDSMGGRIKEEDIKPMLELASKIKSLYELRSSDERYIESTMKKYCPNVLAVAGAMIAAKLLYHARSLKKLASLPASTIQLFGAEKALFRHMKTGARSPRHGLIVQHPLLTNAPQKEHGKRARALADKIALAARLDYFKGSFKGDAMRKELEQKFK